MEILVPSVTSTESFDVVLIGAGVMSATLGTLINQLEPTWSIGLFENLDKAGLESSSPWNNAGTGHSALCELNYTAAKADGSVDPAKAIGINEQFQISRQFYSWAVENKRVADNSFINALPHMSFVIGDDHSKYLKTRYEALKPNALFDELEITNDQDTINEWTPLVAKGRKDSQKVAASRVVSGTDVDFGRLTADLTDSLGASGASINFGHKVKNIKRDGAGWELTVKDKASGAVKTVKAKFVFVGAGGGALPLLQKSGIDEIKGFGGFPVSGQFLRCTDETIINQHHAKVYGQASVGAPPMSVPHLDTRFVDGKRSLMFGPYAGFSMNFLKSTGQMDLPLSLRPHNIIPMLAVAKDNMALTNYLIKEVLKSRAKKDLSLAEYFPEADGSKWELITAGQRVQVIKKDAKKGGVLQFGTEVITSSDGTISGLLGASPGASTATPIMIGLLSRCFPKQFAGWESKLKDIVPSYGQKLNENPALYAEVKAATDKALGLN
ncbi:malate:quinone oxidoreductase [Glutamicibacter protophormiae]|uniref:malate:quinone oxidoreductase n=1 Tax=Glutamicibacter protophormiae TaxID=37930 RepID=UPI002A7F5964|nr:malate:quinone oxidoreductase [Glutamicibacter protophormiae]WPR66059.1 malate:quinone oxidoreductase [Glutamicibacter protophormiae]WPR69556.1 malate:quinone oxidoreductase [Glutamicibacter protophormiae]